MEPSAPWRFIQLKPINLPGMISDEEARYYEWIGQFYRGLGSVIELGPWLGLSTQHIIRGLRSKLGTRKLHVFDDFLWRYWMDQYVSESERPIEHQDFRTWFERNVKDISPLLSVQTRRICDYDNLHVPKIEWDDEPIELMYIDCGRTFEANQAWFDVFSHAFIPDTTLLMMQDWRTHRERPRRHYNETLKFTRRHPEFELIHEVMDGGLATFLYRG